MDHLASILIVEDDLETRRLVHRALTRASFSVDSVGTGRDVVEIVKKGLHDLVIVDLVLPDADGLQLTRQIKAESSAAVIVLSGYTQLDNTTGFAEGDPRYIEFRLYPPPFRVFAPREIEGRIQEIDRELESRDGEEETGLSHVKTSAYMKMEREGFIRYQKILINDTTILLKSFIN